MEQDEIVLDSEALEVLASTENQEKKKKREAIFELALFFVLGALIGITAKTEAAKKITIGFNDYQIKKSAQSYDTAAIKQGLVDQAAQQSASARSGASPSRDGQAQAKQQQQVQAQQAQTKAGGQTK